MQAKLPEGEDTRPFTEVAVGLVIRGAGAQREVLMGQRPIGKPYAGWWEFPGGKIEAGESVAKALARELKEELALEVLSSEPWVVRTHSYPHARVRLHFQRIFRWKGEPKSLEQQAFAWQPIEGISLEPLLPAALPLLDMLRWPEQLGLWGTGLANAVDPGISMDQAYAQSSQVFLKARSLGLRRLVVCFDQSEASIEPGSNPRLAALIELGAKHGLVLEVTLFRIDAQGILTLDWQATKVHLLLRELRFEECRALAEQAQNPFYWPNQALTRLGGHGSMVFL